MAQESADLFIIGAGAGGRIYTRSIYAKMSVVMENRRVQVQGSTSPPMTLIEQVTRIFGHASA